MDLTEDDARNAELVARLTNAPNKAQAVSIALALTSFVAEQLQQRGTALLLDTPDGVKRISMPDLDRIQPQAA
jgi:hypothetical protein